MDSILWQPQLSALALIDAHRAGSFTKVRNIHDNTSQVELTLGLVALATGLICQVAANNGITPDAVIEAYRSGMWAASTT